MKRGQAEIIGLVIVVLLLVFALIFFIKVKTSGDENESQLIRSNLRANSALNALMKVHIENDDEKRQMKDLIEECILNSYQRDNQLSKKCVEVRDELTKYLNSIFDDEEYHLVVSDGDNDLFSLGKSCKSSISASPFIVRNGGKVELKVCT